MKIRHRVSMAVAAAVLAAGATASAQQVNVEQLQSLKNRIQKAQGDVERLVNIGRRGGEEAGGVESDVLAVPILLEASGSLFTAGQRADEALFAALGGNFALATFRFTQACTQTGLARTQVARARLAALAFPPGFLTVVAGDFTLIVNELILLRSPFPTGVGCP